MAANVTPLWMLYACGGLIALAARSGVAAEWLVNPTARVATDYSSNPRLRTQNYEGSAAAVGELSAVLQRRTERSEWSLQPRLYSERHPDEELLDRDDRHLQAVFTHYSERALWSVTTSFAQDTTLTSELGLTGYTEDNRRHEGFLVSGGPTFTLTERTNAGGQLYWSDNHYRDAAFTGLVDYEYAAASVFASHSLSDRAQLSISTRVGDLRVPANSRADKQDASLTLGWTYEPWLLWTLNVSAGPSYARSEVGSDDGTVFKADLQRLGERWTFSTSAGRDVTPTGRGALTRRDQVMVSASRWLAERITGSLTLRGVRTQELLTQSGRAGEELDYGRVDLRVQWRMAEHWSLALGFGGATQRVQSRPDDAENYGASLSLVWNGQPQSL